MCKKQVFRGLKLILRTLKKQKRGSFVIVLPRIYVQEFGITDTATVEAVRTKDCILVKLRV
jgi:hypothetical protein